MDRSLERGERFAHELEGLRLRDPASGRPLWWLRAGVVLMVAGLAVEVVAFFMSHGTTSPLTQRDAIVLGLGGVVLGVVGAAVYLRFAMGNVLRFWLARQSFDLAVQTDELAQRLGADSVTPESEVVG